MFLEIFLLTWCFNPNQYGFNGSKTQNALEVRWRQLKVGVSCSPVFSESWTNFFGSVDSRRVDAGVSTDL